MSYGIGHINTDRLSVANWQFIFLVCGAFTILWVSLPRSFSDWAEQR